MRQMIGLQLEPVDSWFFRDGTPFTAGSAPQDRVTSLFPPYPPTVVGALRAALALEQGWSGRGRWQRELDAVLGDGPNNLGALSFDGPFLVQNDEPLFPAPRHLLGSHESEGWIPRILLQPGPPVGCDLGKAVRLPEMPGTTDTSATLNLKPGDDEWLTLAGLNAVLRGQLPNRRDVVSGACLWSVEARIGLKRDQHLRSAEEGMLYSTRHVRPQPGVALGERMYGLPTDWHLPCHRLVSLGGESRLAECRGWDAAMPLLAPMELMTANKRLTLVALSPLDLEAAVVRGQQPLEIGGITEAGAIHVDVVSACLDRPQRIGGWDSLGRCPLPLRSILPPGSVLFCTISSHGSVNLAPSSGMIHVGSRQEWGFGLVAPGPWPNDCEVAG